MWQARFFLGLVGMIGSGAALAHTGANAGGGWAAGLAHPFMGLDHVLAMVALGVWAIHLGGSYRLLLPAVFVAAMAAGATAAAQGIMLPQGESMLALSVLVLGMLATLAVKTQWHWPVSLVALFAMFHGHAHITEMPTLATPWLYFAGLVTAAACLLALGMAAATVLKARPQVLRAGCAAISLAGTGLLLAALV